MIQLLWWNNRTFNEAIHTQTRLYIFTPIAYVNDRMADGELEILAYVRVEAHDFDILNGGDAWPRFELRTEYHVSATDSVALRISLHRQTHIPVAT